MITRTEKNKEQSDSIIKEEKRNRNKKRKSLIIRIVTIIIIIFSSTYIYMRYIATSGIIVKEYSIYYKNLPEEFDGLKVIQFSKVAYGTTINNKEFKSIVKKINSIKADIILFSGELLDNDNQVNKNEKESLISILNSLEAKIGKYAILDNNDKADAINIFSNTDFHIIENDYELIYYKGINPIILTGINSKNGIKQAYSYYSEKDANNDVFNITITSNEKLVTEIANNYKQNIIVTHDSRSLIKIPFISNYKERTVINNTDVFISSGLGTDKYKLRLFNNPSINFYRLNKDN